MHLISPIFKSGDRSSIRNSRPISLLCTISKVLEKIIYNKIISFVSKSISPSQFGFRPKHSTVQQLLLFTNNLYESFSAKAHSDVIYLDFKKAFESVAHAELMMKLWTFGITGNLWRWFRAYLSARLQRVSINRCTSDLLPVLSGVPQGSILRPILFLIFVNDIPNTIENSQLYMFADDTKCHRSVSSTSDCYSLQNDLQQLSKWSQDWNMFFNDNKCVLLRFSPKPTHSTFHYTINNSTISIQEHHRDLGVIMSNNFTWNAHYIFISAQAYKILGLIRRSFCTGHHSRTKKILYLSLVRSKLIYCSQIWRPHLLKDIITLEKIQRRATKYLLNDFSSSYKSRLLSLNILPLMMQLEMYDILFFIRCLKDPPENSGFNIHSFLSFSNSATRSSTHFKLQHSVSRSNICRHFYFKRLPRLWNSLPTINLDQSISTIRKKLYRFMWNHFEHNFHSDIPCSYHFLCPCNKCACLPVNYNFMHSSL